MEKKEQKIQKNKSKNLIKFTFKNVEKENHKNIFDFQLIGFPFRSIIMYNMNKYQKKTSFTQKPSVAQIASYCLFGAQLSTFYAILMIRIEDEITRTVLHVLFPLNFLIQVLSTLLSSCIDPSDTFMIMFRNERTKAMQEMENVGENLYCDLCRSYVKIKSKHCRSCNRCVEGFDHHCIWINNCVGEKNYVPFMVMIFSSQITMILYLATGGLLWAQAKWHQFLAQMIVIWIIGVVVCVFAVLLINLIILHVYLHCKGLTTYEFILIRREEERLEEVERKAKEEEVQLKKRGNTTISEEVKVETITVHAKNQHQGNMNKTEQAIFSRQHQEANDGLQQIQQKHDSVFSNMQQVHPVFVDEQSEAESSKNSIRISHFFTRNKSLRIFVDDDVEKPKQHIRSLRTQKFPKTVGFKKEHSTK